jgi:hypothetical protein
MPKKRQDQRKRLHLFGNDSLQNAEENPSPCSRKYLAADDWVILPIFSPRPPDGFLTVTLHRKRAFAAFFIVVVVVVVRIR